MINEIYFNDFPKLETERLLLRKQNMTDAVAIQQIRTDARAMKYMDSDPHTSIETSKNFISENQKAYDQKKGIFWTLVEKSSGAMIGDFAFWKIDQKNSRAEIGYTLHPSFWGKGYMREAMMRLIDFGFKDFKIHSMEANINPANENSKRILLNFGFKKEAYHRENYFYNGKYLNTESYSLLQTDLIKH